MRRLLIAAVVAPLLYVAWVAWGLPSRDEIRDLTRTNPRITSLMRQREREAKRASRPLRRVQIWVPINSMSRHLIHAVLASEDQKFFGHEGVDWEAIKKSVETDRAKGRFVRGGSTITQQLAKNLFFTTDKTLTRKLRELVVARWMEQDLSKRRILELYLNVIEWGDGIYGAHAAAQRYYGKAASDLEPAEAAGLAGMIPNPRRINPRVDPKRVARAQRRVLWLMANAGYVEREAMGLGTEPPPLEPADTAEDEEGEPPPAAPEPEATPEPTAAPAQPTPEPTTTPEPITTPTPSATPEPSATPGVG